MSGSGCNLCFWFSLMSWASVSQCFHFSTIPTLLTKPKRMNPHLQLEHSWLPRDRPQKKACVNLNWQLAVGLVDLLLWLLQERIRVSAKGFREAQFSLQYTASSKRGRPSFVFLGLCFSLLQTCKHTKTKCFWLISSGLISLCVTVFSLMLVKGPGFLQLFSFCCAL